MRAWLKRSEAIVLPFILTACAGSESGLEVRALELQRTPAACHLNVRLGYVFSPEVLAALHNGVPITVLVQARIKRERDWLWDATLSRDARRFVLSQHTLSGQYLVHSRFDDKRLSLPTLDAALEAMEQIDHWTLAACPDRPAPDVRFGVRVRLELDNLPAPLRLTALLSPAWRLDSGWVEDDLP